MWLLSSTEGGKKVCEKRELTPVFWCQSRRAVKKKSDEVKIKDNTQNEYKSLPVVTSYSIPCSLFEPNWIVGKKATLLQVWQWKIDHKLTFPVLHITVSFTGRWRLTRYTEINHNCLISTATLHFSSLSPLWGFKDQTRSMWGFVNTVWCHHTNLAKQFCPKPSAFMGRRASSEKSLLVSAPYWNSDDDMHGGSIYTRIRAVLQEKSGWHRCRHAAYRANQPELTHTHRRMHAHTQMQNKHINKLLQHCRYRLFLRPIWLSD